MGCAEETGKRICEFSDNVVVTLLLINLQDFLVRVIPPPLLSLSETEVFPLFDKTSCNEFFRVYLYKDRLGTIKARIRISCSITTYPCH